MTPPILSPPTMLDADFTVARRSFDVVARMSLSPNDRLSIYGPSGAGKTTCLEAIAGTVPLTRGRIAVGGGLVNVARPKRSRDGRTRDRPLEPRSRGITAIRQPTTLFPHMSVAANVTYGLKSVLAAGDRSVEELIERVGLGGLALARPDALSGGQRQRACLARAIARKFHALLLDEPFSAIDMASRADLRSLAVQATEREAAVAVLVTHDLGEAQSFAHRMAIMDSGRILQTGDAELLVRRPATTRVAELCGYMSFLPHDSSRCWALHPDRFVEGSWSDRGPVLKGTVISVQAYGARFACEMAHGSHPSAPGSPPAAVTPAQSIVRVHVDSPPRVGDSWEVTSLDPPLVSRVSPSGGEEGSIDCQKPAATRTTA